MESFEIQFTFIAPASTVFENYLDSEKHSMMTGGEAEISPNQGEGFTAWDGYIEGVNIEIVSGEYIKQEWRTSEFSSSDEDSVLELIFQSDEKGNCLLTLKHSNIPDGQGENYKKGWYDHYFHPMEAFYNSNG